MKVNDNPDTYYQQTATDIIPYLLTESSKTDEREESVKKHRMLIKTLLIWSGARLSNV